MLSKLIKSNEKLWRRSAALSSNAAVKPTQEATAKATTTTKEATKPLVTNRFGKNLVKISVWYLVVIVAGITAFYYAKKDVYQNRVENMKIRKEIASLSSSEADAQKYPSRQELLKREKNEKKNTN